MARLIRLLSWLMAAAYGLGIILETDAGMHFAGPHELDGLNFAVWLIGAAILEEISKWRRI